ncbi:MAG: DUF885 domain-containing protein, partial [Gemmatimonadota bacterium]|nr:DUF885 domain-containing protein [Gemmatimonadota bacterium]
MKISVCGRALCPAFVASLVVVLLAACSSDKAPSNTAGSNAKTPSGSASPADSSFVALTHQIIDSLLRHKPSLATDLGIHRFDGDVEDMSKTGQAAAAQSLKGFRAQVVAADTMALSAVNRADRAFVLASLDAGILEYDVIRKWTKDPDSYSSGVTNAAYTIMKRNFAPPSDRLKSLIQRERKLPAQLVDARNNLDNPPRIYTEIALEQIDG